jgi:hypothetical protein
MKIASRYRPFSHQPGTALIIPGTCMTLRAYPTAFFIQDEKGEEIRIEWALKGVVEDFTVMQDLERSHVLVYGRAREGYFRYSIQLQESHLMLRLDRASMGHLKGVLYPAQTPYTLQPKEQIILFTPRQGGNKREIERISFGNHQTQEWERIRARKDPLEYFPFWFAAGQRVVQQDRDSQDGTLYLLQECRAYLEQGKEELFLNKMHELFQIGFEGILLPKLYDTHYLGVLCSHTTQLQIERPVQLLREGYQLIRAMLVQEEENRISVLPCLPSVFHAGRCLDFQMRQVKCSIEWSKKLLKKMILTSFSQQTLHLSVHKAFQNFRLKSPRYPKGVTLSCGHPLQLDAGIYILDQFRK